MEQNTKLTNKRTKKADEFENPTRSAVIDEGL